MLPKSLSWVALGCSALAVLFNAGLLGVAMRHADASVVQSIAPILAAIFLSSGPVVAIVTLLSSSPIARRYTYAARGAVD